MLMKGCAKCGKLIPYGHAYCVDCTAQVEEAMAKRLAEHKQKYNHTYNTTRRDPKYQQFYRSKAWKMLSRGRLQRDGWRCVRCGNIATEVDHIIPIQQPDGWDKRFDVDNLQSLCTRCHNEKHGRYMPSRKNTSPHKKQQVPAKI